LYLSPRPVSGLGLVRCFEFNRELGLQHRICSTLRTHTFLWSYSRAMPGSIGSPSGRCVSFSLSDFCRLLKVGGTRCRTNMAHIRQSTPDSGLGLIKVLKHLLNFPLFALLSYVCRIRRIKTRSHQRMWLRSAPSASRSDASRHLFLFFITLEARVD
jgi:hypothetical protein